jgi:hypothetical protein
MTTAKTLEAINALNEGPLFTVNPHTGATAPSGISRRELRSLATEMAKLQDMFGLAERICFAGSLNAGIALVNTSRGWLVHDWSKATDTLHPTLIEAFDAVRSEVEIWTRQGE